jgi:hypothetical protein
LAGGPQDLKGTERVAHGTGKVVEPPRLHATLKLENALTDPRARFLVGKVEYVDVVGKPIASPEVRSDTSFTLPSYQPDCPGPGMDVLQGAEVPSPSPALLGRKLRDIRLDLTFIPMASKEQTVQVHVSAGG